MEEKTLLRIAIVCTLVGTLLLLLLTDKPTATGYPIKDLNRSIIGSKVKVSGLVEDVNVIKGVMLLEINDETGSIAVAIFNDEDIYAGNYVEVIGNIKEYKGKLEVEAEEVTVIEGVQKFLQNPRK